MLVFKDGSMYNPKQIGSQEVLRLLGEFFEEGCYVPGGLKWKNEVVKCIIAGEKTVHNFKPDGSPRLTLSYACLPQGVWDPLEIEL